MNSKESRSCIPLLKGIQERLFHHLHYTRILGGTPFCVLKTLGISELRIMKLIQLTKML